MSRQDWRTPPSVYEALSKRFGPFDCDMAADDLNHLCERYLTMVDGPPAPERLGYRNWCNPPFGNVLPFMVAAAGARILTDGAETIMLSHANPNSPWFHFGIGRAALHCPDRRIGYWHPDELESSHHGGPSRDTVIWHFGGEPGRIYTIEIPEHRKETRRLTAEAQGQLTITGGLF